LTGAAGSVRLREGEIKEKTMSAPASHSHVSDLELLHEFIGHVLQNGGGSKTVDEVLDEFREYLEELERLREEIRPALEASLRGESKPIDWESLKERVTRRLAEQGITD
jgi:hypothetical protein